jgi:hypothetical protein
VEVPILFAKSGNSTSEASSLQESKDIAKAVFMSQLEILFK